MAKYKKVDTDLKFVDREKEVEKFWNEEDIFKKSMENRKEGETYTFPGKMQIPARFSCICTHI